MIRLNKFFRFDSAPVSNELSVFTQRNGSNTSGGLVSAFNRVHTSLIMMQEITKHTSLIMMHTSTSLIMMLVRDPELYPTLQP